jgi:hypothetical protein
MIPQTQVPRLDPQRREPKLQTCLEKNFARTVELAYLLLDDP